MDDVFIQIALTTHDVRIEVYLFGQCVHSRSAVVVFYRFQLLFYRTFFNDESQKLYLAFSKFHLLVNKKSRFDVAIISWVPLSISTLK